MGNFVKELPAGHALPKVSILIASYNRLSALKSAIKSALQQDYPQKEIVIVDDGSGPLTSALLKRLARIARQIKIHFQTNQGPAVARARGVELCTGDYICILDSDDILREGAISAVMHYFLQDRNLDMVYVNNRKIFQEQVVGISRYKHDCNQNRLKRHVFLSPVVPFKHSGMTFKRATIIDLGNYDRELKRKVDVDIFLRFLTQNKKIKLLDKPPLVDFVQNAGSISRSRIMGIQCWYKIINKYERRFFARTLYKSMRTGSELAKMLIEFLRYSHTAS